MPLAARPFRAGSIVLLVLAFAVGAFGIPGAIASWHADADLESNGTRASSHVIDIIGLSRADDPLYADVALDKARSRVYRINVDAIKNIRVGSRVEVFVSSDSRTAAAVEAVNPPARLFTLLCSVLLTLGFLAASVFSYRITALRSHPVKPWGRSG